MPLIMISGAIASQDDPPSTQIIPYIRSKVAISTIHNHPDGLTVHSAPAIPSHMKAMNPHIIAPMRLNW
jgi:hypothetical protein